LTEWLAGAAGNQFEDRHGIHAKRLVRSGRGMRENIMVGELDLGKPCCRPGKSNALTGSPGALLLVSRPYREHRRSSAFDSSLRGGVTEQRLIPRTPRWSASVIRYERFDRPCEELDWIDLVSLAAWRRVSSISLMAWRSGLVRGVSVPNCRT